MKRIVMVLLLASSFPALMVGQQSKVDLPANPSAASPENSAAPASALSLSLQSAAAWRNVSASFAFAQEPQVEQKPKPTKTPKPPKPPSADRPSIGGSMVAYIDNAIIGSQIRMRFDAGFDNNSPDRAEFFYAKCGCYRVLNGNAFAAAFDPNAPGPGTGIPTAINFQQLRFNLEYALVRRFSVFADVPIR